MLTKDQAVTLTRRYVQFQSLLMVSGAFLGMEKYFFGFVFLAMCVAFSFSSEVSAYWRGSAAVRTSAFSLFVSSLSIGVLSKDYLFVAFTAIALSFALFVYGVFVRWPLIHDQYEALLNKDSSGNH